MTYPEARSIVEAAVKEPYQSAVERLKDDPMWRKYARLDA